MGGTGSLTCIIRPARASLVQVQSWTGHSHIQTPARYLHHRSQATDAALLAEAFAGQTVSSQGSAKPPAVAAS